ncbi:hypothetical protein E4U30_002946 [Claviceps sp. LM220 group G6]|nr:hypothetical protein E4U30_002946 [Claviceps sp. LM220 group G6]
MLMSVKIESIPFTLAAGLGVANPAGRRVKVFLRIGEDPSRVEYHLTVPIRDVESVEVEGDADCQLVYGRLLETFSWSLVEHLVDMALTYPVMTLLQSTAGGGRQTRQIPNIELRDHFSSASNNTNIGRFIEE